MTPQRMAGIVLLVVGVALFIIGLNSSHSIADRVSDTFTGRFTQSTTWYIVGGPRGGARLGVGQRTVRQKGWIKGGRHTARLCRSRRTPT